MSYLEVGAARVWYFCSSQQLNYFEQISFRYLLNPAYFNDYKDGGLQMFAEKLIVFNPCISRNFDATLPFHSAIQKQKLLRSHFTHM